MDIRGTKTQENLLRAFNVESEAKNKYEIYAAKAKKDGYEQIAALFLETARNEYAHPQLWFILLRNVCISATVISLELVKTKSSTIFPARQSLAVTASDLLVKNSKPQRLIMATIAIDAKNLFFVIKIPSL